MRNKNEIEYPVTIIVRKDNFLNSLEEFKNLLKSKFFEYIIINNEISTSNPKTIENEGEIVFSEFNICYTSNNHIKFTTFFIPSIKYHRYSEDEIASFNSVFLTNLYNESIIYSFDSIYKSNSISYENINKREKLEKNLDLILKDGKPFNEENIKSYNYFPKAIEIPAKNIQNKFVKTLKNFLEQNFKEDEKKIFLDNNIYSYKSNEYEVNYKIINRLLNLKWGLIFENFDNDAYKIVVDGYKIEILSKKNKLRSDFIDFIQQLKNLLINFYNDKNEIKEFEVLIKHKDMDDELFQNWSQYINEGEMINFEYKFIEKEEEKFIKFILMEKKYKEKKDNIENILKFLDFVLTIKKEFHDKNEFIIDNIAYRRINMKLLFPKKARKNIKFSYHLSSRIDSYKFKLNKNKDEYLSKIFYKKLLIHNKSDEEILFGYKIKPLLKELFKIRDTDNEKDINKDIVKQINIEFSKDLEILLNNKKFDEERKKYFSKLDFSLYNPQTDKFRIIRYILNKKPDFKNEEFIIYFDNLLNIAKDIKKNNLLEEEIGLSNFYKILYDKENINIYGTNLKQKIYFPIRKLLLDINKNKEEVNKEIENMLNKINIYDISYICKEKNINFYLQYINLKKDENLKNLTITQKLGYIIQKNDILKNREKLQEYKNKFYSDEKNNNDKKLYINIDKNKFYDKADKIFNILKNKTDFTVNLNKDNNKIFQINFIEPQKFNEINNIINEINSIY